MYLGNPRAALWVEETASFAMARSVVRQRRHVKRGKLRPFDCAQGRQARGVQTGEGDGVGGVDEGGAPRQWPRTHHGRSRTQPHGRGLPTPYSPPRRGWRRADGGAVSTATERRGYKGKPADGHGRIHTDAGYPPLVPLRGGDRGGRTGGGSARRPRKRHAGRQSAVATKGVAAYTNAG